MTKMNRRRKVAVIVENGESDEDRIEAEANLQNATINHGPMHSIMCHIQHNQTYHAKYVKEMQQLYCKMDHDAFVYTFIRMIKSAMEAEEANEFAKTTLLFCAKYVTSYEDEDTHPVLIAIFDWLLGTISQDAHIRYRLCQFVNLILNALGPEAALDDCICDHIMGYMINRLRDLNPGVRVQAILALQRLQMPTNPDDVIVKTYLFHLGSDPSPKVRQAVITSIGKNFNTIPYIMERLWDVDEKVRKHTYLHMSSVSVKAYKVSQRLTFLEQGFSDRSEMVKKVVNTVMLPQWLETYNKDFIAFISAMKLDANESEMDRFRKITKVVLREMFLKQKVEDLITRLPLETEGEFYKCIAFDNLSVELTLYWLCLIEFLQNQMDDEIDTIIPELSTFCSYVLQYCKSAKVSMDKWAKLEHNYVILTLMEIVLTFDLGDEIGRENLKQLFADLLKNYALDENVIEVIARCSENLMTEQEIRLQFFVDIIRDLAEPKNWNMSEFNDILEKQADKTLKLKLSSLKVKILDLKEQEMNYVEKKEYVEAQKIADERNACWEEYVNLIKPPLSDASTSQSDESIKSLASSLQVKKITTETIIKCLQMAFHMIVSKKVKSLTPNVCELYKDFIRRHIESNQAPIRDWALKCGTAYSMLYDQLSKDVYNELYAQFFKNQNTRIWKTSIDCIFELLDRYGFAHFEIEDKQNKSTKAGRLLYSSEFVENEEDTSTVDAGVIFMMSHFLDTCEDVNITSAVVNGFCRLVLHGHIKNDDIMEKLLLKYFNPITEPEINQILGVFFENLIAKKKQELLQPSLLPTVSTILSAPYDSPLHEIKPDTVIKFVVDSTRPIFCSPGLNIHNTIALSFMQEMLNNISSKELIKILAKELITLEIPVSEDGPLKNDLNTCCEKLLECNLDPKTEKYIKNFKDLLDGNFETANKARMNDADASEEDEEDENSVLNVGKSTLNTNKDVHKTPGNRNKTICNDLVEENDLDNNSLSKDKDKSMAENTNKHNSPELSRSNIIPVASPSSPLGSMFKTPGPRELSERELIKMPNLPGSLRKSLLKRNIQGQSVKGKNLEKSITEQENSTNKNKALSPRKETSASSNKENENSLPPLEIDESTNKSVAENHNADINSSDDEVIEKSSNESESVPPSPPKQNKVVESVRRLRSKRQAITSIKGKKQTVSEKTGAAKRRLKLSMSPRNSSGDEKINYVPSKKQTRKSINISDTLHPNNCSKTTNIQITITTPTKNKNHNSQEISKGISSLNSGNKQPILTTQTIGRTRAITRKEFQATNTMTRSKSAFLVDGKLSDKNRTFTSLSAKKISEKPNTQNKKNNNKSKSPQSKSRRRLMSGGEDESESESLASFLSDVDSRKNRSLRSMARGGSALSEDKSSYTNRSSRSLSAKRISEKSGKQGKKHENSHKSQSRRRSEGDESENENLSSFSGSSSLVDSQKGKEKERELRKDKENKVQSDKEKEIVSRRSARKKVPTKNPDFV